MYDELKSELIQASDDHRHRMGRIWKTYLTALKAEIETRKDAARGGLGPIEVLLVPDPHALEGRLRMYRRGTTQVFDIGIMHPVDEATSYIKVEVQNPFTKETLAIRELNIQSPEVTATELRSEYHNTLIQRGDLAAIRGPEATVEDIA